MMAPLPSKIRRLTISDVEAFRAIRLEALKTNPEAFGSTFEEESVAPPSRYSEWLANSQIFGAFVQEKLAGIAAFGIYDGRKDAHKGWLRSMYVSPNYRGSGAASHLVEAVIAAARSQVEILHLVVVSENTAAIRLYRKFGFQQYGTDRRALKDNGRYYDEILMRLDLTTSSPA